MGKKVKKESKTPCNDTFDPLTVKGTTPATAVLLLSSTEEEILVSACEAIHSFADKGDENKASLLGLGVLEHLCQLITHDNKLVRRNAIMALGVMTSNGDVKKALKEKDVIPAIIAKLSPEEDTAVHEYATLCLASLSLDFITKNKIFENQGLPPLIRLLSSSDPDVQKQSVEVIFNLVQDYQSRLAVHELAGIPPLLELLKSDYPVIQHLALKTLQNITTDRDTRNTFREETGFEKLMDILSNSNLGDLHAEALQVVANCVSDSESLKLIHKDGGLTRLMEFVLTSNPPEVQSSAVKCISRVAQSSENRTLLHQDNVEKVLMELLAVADVSVKTAACQAVAAMSVHPGSRYLFNDLGGIPAIVQLLNHQSLVLREAATEALANLTTSNESNALAVHEAGGHEILVQQLYERCSRLVANCAIVLCNMAEQEVIRRSISSHGAIPALVQALMSTDAEVLVNATRCLAALVCDTETKTQLLQCGGFQPLVNLLRSHHKEVLRNASWAIKVCASDVASAVELCKFGALEMLRDINQSNNRNCNFSRLAMVSLLNSNLSVKYSYTYLSPTDVIGDGFYDAGRAREGERILTLEEMAKMPVDVHLPIIYVNTSTEEAVDVPDEKQSNTSETETGSKGGRKTPRKVDDKQKDKTEPPTEKPWKMMEDVALQNLIKEAKESIIPLSTEREQYAALARLVSDAMGGAVDQAEMQRFSWVVPQSHVKYELQSNVAPIGLIRKGTYRHRALLFKCLADRIGLSCSLVRGESDRGWNEVLLLEGNPSRKERYIVDLMHEPGSLLETKSYAAVHYCKTPS